MKKEMIDLAKQYGFDLESAEYEDLCNLAVLGAMIKRVYESGTNEIHLIIDRWESCQND